MPTGGELGLGGAKGLINRQCQPNVARPGGVSKHLCYRLPGDKVVACSGSMDVQCSPRSGATITLCGSDDISQ